jgi:hypothetical protein
MSSGLNMRSENLNPNVIALSIHGDSSFQENSTPSILAALYLLGGKFASLPFFS